MKKLLVRNGQLINVATREILSWEVGIEDGRICCMGENLKKWADDDAEIIDAAGSYLVPGLISAHDHFEMTFTTPIPYAEVVIPHGTTAALMDPHQTVNVLGLNGLRMMMEEAKRTPFKAIFGMPPCVPSARGFENAGYEVRLSDVQEALKIQGVIGLAETIDFARVIKREPGIVEILNWARESHKLIDGHCPGVRGMDLCDYLSLGPIRTDHESLDLSEQIEKLRMGMYVIVRRASIKEPMNAGELVAQVKDTSRLLLAVDGCIAVKDLITHGHMSWAVRQIIAEGVDPLIAIQMGTLNVARCYGLDHWIGIIAPGRSADILFVDDLKEFQVRQVMVDGQLIQTPMNLPRMEHELSAIDTIRIDPVTSGDFAVYAPDGSGAKVKVRVIGVIDGALVTKALEAELSVTKGNVLIEPEHDVIKVAILERYGGNTKSIGFIHGFGLKSGAFAGSVGLDSENIVVVGADDNDMAVAVNRVKAINGGLVVVNAGNIIDEVALPVAGHMTDMNMYKLNEKLESITLALRNLGCPISDPAFTLSTDISLVAIPDLKMNNLGLVDVMGACLVDLFI